MVAVRKTRKQIERERAKQAKHYEYIKDYRGDVGSPYRPPPPRRTDRRKPRHPHAGSSPSSSPLSQLGPLGAWRTG